MGSGAFRLCCGQQHEGPICPDNKVMCQLCFDRFDQNDLWVDSKNDKWDMCKECGDNKERIRLSLATKKLGHL